MTVHLFVYGTLREGESNHWLLEELSAVKVAECQTPPLFTLLNLGHYPGLIRGGNTAVRGELYRLNRSALDRLDRFEGHPDLFRREELLTELKHIHTDGVVVEGAVAYIYRGAGALPSGDWKDRLKPVWEITLMGRLT